MNLPTRGQKFFALLLGLACCTSDPVSPPDLDAAAPTRKTVAHVTRAAFLACAGSECDSYLAAHATELSAASSICTRTESLIFQVDGTGTCLGCMMKAGCLHDSLGDDKNECDDADVFQDRGTTDQCLYTLGCLFGLPAGGCSKPVKVKLPNRIWSAHCGAQGGPKCERPSGTCAAFETDGFDDLEPRQMAKLFTKKIYPSGMANAIGFCSRACEPVCHLGL